MPQSLDCNCWQIMAYVKLHDVWCRTHLGSLALVHSKGAGVMTECRNEHSAAMVRFCISCNAARSPCSNCSKKNCIWSEGSILVVSVSNALTVSFSNCGLCTRSSVRSLHKDKVTLVNSWSSKTENFDRVGSNYCLQAWDDAFVCNAALGGSTINRQPTIAMVSVYKKRYDEYTAGSSKGQEVLIQWRFLFAKRVLSVYPKGLQSEDVSCWHVLLAPQLSQLSILLPLKSLNLPLPVHKKQDVQPWNRFCWGKPDICHCKHWKQNAGSLANRAEKLFSLLWELQPLKLLYLQCKVRWVQCMQRTRCLEGTSVSQYKVSSAGSERWAVTSTWLMTKRSLSNLISRTSHLAKLGFLCAAAVRGSRTAEMPSRASCLTSPYA